MFSNHGSVTTLKLSFCISEALQLWICILFALSVLIVKCIFVSLRTGMGILWLFQSIFVHGISFLHVNLIAGKYSKKKKKRKNHF